MEKMGTRDTREIGAALAGMTSGRVEGFTTHGAFFGLGHGVEGARVWLADEVAGGDGYEVRRAFADAVDRGRMIRGVVRSYKAPVAVLVAKEGDDVGTWFVFDGYRGSVTTSRHRNTVRRALAAVGIDAPDFTPENVVRALAGVELDSEGMAAVVRFMSDGVDMIEAVELAAGVLV